MSRRRMSLLDVEGGRLAAFGERIPVSGLGAVAIFADACASFVAGAHTGHLRDALERDFVSLYGDGGAPFDPLSVALAGSNVAAQPRPLSHNTALALLIMAHQANADQSDAAVRVLLGGDIKRRHAVTAEILRLLMLKEGVPSANMGALREDVFARLRDCMATAWHAYATRMATQYGPSIRTLAADNKQRHILMCIASGGTSAATP